MNINRLRPKPGDDLALCTFCSRIVEPTEPFITAQVADTEGAPYLRDGAGEAQHRSRPRAEPRALRRSDRVSWMLRPRHERRVINAARRAAACDEREACDDWIMHGLKTARRAALAAGYERSQVDAWTMAGCVEERGR